MADEHATSEPPPSPPSDNGDRLNRSPDRLVEAKTKAKRVMSEKQLENLPGENLPRYPPSSAPQGKPRAKVRRPKSTPKQQTPQDAIDPQGVTGENLPRPEPQTPEPSFLPSHKAKPKPKTRVVKPQPTPKTTQMVMEPATLNFSVF